MDKYPTNLPKRDIHTRFAAQLFGVLPEAVTPEQRAQAKTINYATVYSRMPRLRPPRDPGARPLTFMIRNDL